MSLLPGTEVSARGLRWEVANFDSLGAQTLYRLRGLEGAVQGQEIDLLHPFERIQPIEHELQPTKAAPLRNWFVYHQAFLLEQAFGSNALLAVQPGRLELQPYQLVPVLRALRMSRVRLLLADGVGLGKTIQAGLVLTELVARRIAHRIMIVSPAGPLLEQWKTEMSERFGLRLDVIDRARLQEIRRGTELGANPFDHIPFGLVSIDFLKQERILDQLERASYDVVIIDEAHHCMDLGAAQEREDSQRRRLAQVLARRCDALLLLTATPHDGNERSFASLCELLDPSLTDGRGVLREDRYRSYVVRRLKRHIKDPQTGDPLFKDRSVDPVPVSASPSEYPKFVELQRALLDLLAPELRRAFRARRYSDVLAFIALLKRSVSTVAACKSTLSVVAERFHDILKAGTTENQESRRQRLRTLREYNRKLERFGSVSTEEEEEKHLLEAEDLAHQLVALGRKVRSGSRQVRHVASVVETLDTLVVLAEEASDEDPKLMQLLETVNGIRKKEPGTNILIYTEYTTSQEAAVRILETGDVGNILTMSGYDGDARRKDVTFRFRTQDNLILVSTDAAAEGLNLHQRCHHLIHLELPFNPNRLEQRNGRIDRYGQTKNPMVRYLFLRGTFEERILLRLIAKYERQRSRLTFVPNTLGVTSSTASGAERLLRGIMDDDTRLFKEDSPLLDMLQGDENEGLDEATQDLLEEVDRSLSSFERATRLHTWLGETGLNSEERLLNQADQAHQLGKRVGIGDLAGFVRDAILLDGGDMIGSVDDDIFEIILPPAWRHGLEELPGYDSSSHRVRLTLDSDLTYDKEGHLIGFLGRAHPLVRRALDRVRNLSFGGAAQAGQDVRVSAVTADVEKPALLYTYLGRISSVAGREFEQVLAVKLSSEGESEVCNTAEEWVKLVDPDRAIRTSDVWETHFEGHFEDADIQSRKAVEDVFQNIGEVFIRERREILQRERQQQDEWLRQRVKEITGTGAPQAEQIALFENLEKETPEEPSWASLSDPAECLAAYATDRRQPPGLRSEADGVLRIYRQRLTDLDSRLNLGEPEVVPIGLLMLVPGGTYGS